jgi:hypothetical protein
MTIHAADFQSATIPEGIAIEEKPIGLRTGCSSRPGKDSHGKIMSAGRGFEFNKPRVSAKKRMTFAVRLDALRSRYGLEGGCEFFKPVAGELVESKVSTDQ